MGNPLQEGTANPPFTTRGSKLPFPLFKREQKPIQVYVLQGIRAWQWKNLQNLRRTEPHQTSMTKGSNWTWPMKWNPKFQHFCLRYVSRSTRQAPWCPTQKNRSRGDTSLRCGVMLFWPHRDLGPHGEKQPTTIILGDVDDMQKNKTWFLPSTCWQSSWEKKRLTAHSSTSSPSTCSS